MPKGPRRNPIKFKRIRGDHAIVSEVPKSRIRFATRRRVIERWSKNKLDVTEVALYSHAHTLAHLLFPRNFVKPIASAIDGSAHYSELRDIDEASRTGIIDFYKTSRWEKYLNHTDRIYSNDKVRDRSITLRQAGIFVNTKPMNIGFDKIGEPVFFEIACVSPRLLKKYIQKKVGNGTLKKKQTMELLGEIERLAQRSPNPHLIDTHDKSGQLL